MKVFYLDCSGSFWVEVASRLQKESGWEPIYWVASPRLESEVKARFPSAIFHSELDAVRSIPASELAGTQTPPLDATLLEELAECEVAALHMMDRMDGGGTFLHRERVRLYHRLLRYWLGVLRTYQPDLAVFVTAPHAIYDYVLFELCKVLGIKTAMFETTMAYGLIYPVADFRQHPELINNYHKILSAYNGGEVRLSPAGEEYLRKLSGPHKQMPKYLLHAGAKALIEKIPRPAEGEIASDSGLHPYVKWGKTCLSKLRSSIKDSFLLPASRPPPNYVKKAGKRPEESPMTGREYRVFRRSSLKKVRQLEHFYHQRVHPVDLTRPYIYFALNYQPERTTSPLGGVFVDQYLMIELIAKSLPKGWRLYVKEHPTQFYSGRAFRAQSTRDEAFYTDITSLEQVSLVPMSESPVALIDSAQAVAAVGGTTGWQAINRGKPVFVSGYPWYLGCEGVFHVQTQASCQETFDKIVAGYTVDRTKLRLFLQALEKTSVVAYIDPTYKDAYDRDGTVSITEEANVRALVGRLQSFIASQSQIQENGETHPLPDTSCAGLAPDFATPKPRR